MIPASTWIESASPFSISTRRSGRASRTAHLRPGARRAAAPSVGRGGLTVEWIALRRAEYAASVPLTSGTDERRANGPAGGDDDRRGRLDVPNAGCGDPSWTRFRRSRRAGRATRRGPERIHGTADVRYRRSRRAGGGGRP